MSDLKGFPSDWPEIEILPLATTLGPAEDDDNYASITMAVLTTTSRGTVTISSSDTEDNPIVNPNWLATRTDQEIAVQAFKRAREIAQATGITIGNEIAPGPRVQTDEQILAYIKETLSPIHHAAASCELLRRGPPFDDCVLTAHSLGIGAMGATNDTKAPVDTQGLVFGVQRLRIADASIFLSYHQGILKRQFVS